MLGIGIGGAPREHEAYGIDFPPAPERVARLEEAVAVIRALWTGGPVTRPSPFYPLRDAVRAPGPGSAATDRHRRGDARPAPRLAGADRRRLDGVRRQLRDATCRVYLESLEAAGRRREDQTVLVGFQGDWD